MQPLNEKQLKILENLGAIRITPEDLKSCSPNLAKALLKWDALVPALVERLRELAAAHLLRRMHELSVKYLESQWYMGLEYALWKAITDKSEKLNPAEIMEIKQLTIEANGWYYYPEDATEPRFIPTSKWLSLYKEYAEGDISKGIQSGPGEFRLPRGL